MTVSVRAICNDLLHVILDSVLESRGEHYTTVAILQDVRGFSPMFNIFCLIFVYNWYHHIVYTHTVISHTLSQPT